MQTKSCNLTKDEIKSLIADYGRQLHAPTDQKMERLAYLHKRLKSFEKETVSNNSAAGWSSSPASSKGEDE